jgi:hypothetical protein
MSYRNNLDAVTSALEEEMRKNDKLMGKLAELRSKLKHATRPPELSLTAAIFVFVVVIVCMGGGMVIQDNISQPLIPLAGCNALENERRTPRITRVRINDIFVGTMVEASDRYDHYYEMIVEDTTLVSFDIRDVSFEKIVVFYRGHIMPMFQIKYDLEFINVCVLQKGFYRFVVIGTKDKNFAMKISKYIKMSNS